MKERHVILLLVGVIVLAVLAIVGFAAYRFATGFLAAYDYADQVGSPAEFRKLIGKQIGCELPDSAADLHMVQDAGIDPTIWVAFRVDPADLSKLDLGVGEPGPLPELPRTVPERIRSWWTPPTTGVRVRLDGSGPDGFVCGRMWIVDPATGSVYYCDYTS
jgi:hypothetical protein